MDATSFGYIPFGRCWGDCRATSLLHGDLRVWSQQKRTSAMLWEVGSCHVVRCGVGWVCAGYVFVRCLLHRNTCQSWYSSCDVFGEVFCWWQDLQSRQGVLSTCACLLGVIITVSRSLLSFCGDVDGDDGDGDVFKGGSFNCVMMFLYVQSHFGEVIQSV